MVFEGLAAGALSGGLDLVGGLLGSKSQKSENRKAFERDFFMWNAQNAYNHPSAQMARLKEAGLNPMLVYGNGSVFGNTSGSAPSYRPADVTGKYSGLGKGFSSYVAARQLNQNLQLGQEQIDQVKANTQLLRSQIFKNDIEALGSALDLKFYSSLGLPRGANRDAALLEFGRKGGDFLANFVNRMTAPKSDSSTIFDKIKKRRADRAVSDFVSSLERSLNDR